MGGSHDKSIIDNYIDEAEMPPRRRREEEEEAVPVGDVVAVLHVHPELQGRLPLAASVAGADGGVGEGGVCLEAEGLDAPVDLEGLPPRLVLLAQDPDELREAFAAMTDGRGRHSRRRWQS